MNGQKLSKQPEPPLSDYLNRTRNYYYFSPSPLQRVNAWKKQSLRVDLVTTAGHQVWFPEREIYPENFIFHHYAFIKHPFLGE